MSVNVIEKGVRKKVRFEAIRKKNNQKVSLSCEDLYDVPLISENPDIITLDNIAIDLSKQLKEYGEISFVKKTTRAHSLLKLKLDIVEYVIETLMEENKAAEERAVNRTKADKIKKLLSEMDDEDLKKKSREDLIKELAELEK